MPRSKYGAVPTMVDGHRFASRREAARYQELRIAERAGLIQDLVLQPRYPLVVGGMRIAVYVADFRYQRGGAIVVEDCKGYRTRDYKLRRKLMKACYNIEILET